MMRQIRLVRAAAPAPRRGSAGCRGPQADLFIETNGAWPVARDVAACTGLAGAAAPAHDQALRCCARWHYAQGRRPAGERGGACHLHACCICHVCACTETEGARVPAHRPRSHPSRERHRGAGLAVAATTVLELRARAAFARRCGLPKAALGGYWQLCGRVGLRASC
jgi:hypothetical protein